MKVAAFSKFPTRSMLARFPLIALALFLAAPALHAQEKKEEGPPKEEDLSWTTEDGVKLKATYWEPEEPGDSTVPIILLHGWQGKRQEYDALAGDLQALGHMVVSLDLRGHGGSMEIARPDLPMDIKIDPEKMTRADFYNMYRDVHETKKFLMDQHREGKCNIKLLTIVGADMGALVALNYAYYDWTRPILPRPRNCKGQDVRAVVLLSPPRSFKGMTAETALKHPVVRGNLSTMIIVGDKDSNDAFRDAKSLHAKLERFHAKMPRDEKDPEGWKLQNQDLFLLSPQPSTSLQGTTLLTQQGLRVDAMIKKFIEIRAMNKADEYPWGPRD